MTRRASCNDSRFGTVLRGVAMALAVSLWAACGDDDDADSSESEADAAKPFADDELPCGREVCKLPDRLEGETLCCMDPFSGGCGIKSVESCRPIPEVDERCPTLDLGLGSGANVVPLFGCCTADNECGVDFMGACQPRSIACNFVSKARVEMIQPQTCEGEPLPLPEVCGF
jgi:hypothetical protein